MRFKKRIPVTLVGGFLGAGKTTLVNRLIESGEKKYGVVVNEFGDVNIDSEIIEEMEDGGVAELGGGCLCCVGREDLSVALYGLVCRDEPPEHILIELSGLADPVPVAQQLLTTEWRGLLDLDGIVAVADAVNLRETMDEAPEGKSQLAYASVVVLNKGDLVGVAKLEEAEGIIEELNPMAEVIKTSRAKVETKYIIGLGAFSPDWKPRGHKLAHGKNISSVTLRAERPLRIEDWVSFHRRMMIRREGIYRAKGILHFEGMDEPMLLQAVRGLYTFETYEGKHDGGSELVVIGRNLDEAEYREAFEKVLV
ncbi:MAG: GTP-binding protein [Actinomycetota bacterium]|nr:GTP-binding protein [Rubrobacter sp.]MDQ3507045.1 GTP-binding protein [Actinomycetota bacterium]